METQPVVAQLTIAARSNFTVKAPLLASEKQAAIFELVDLLGLAGVTGDQLVLGRDLVKQFSARLAGQLRKRPLHRFPFQLLF